MNPSHRKPECQTMSCRQAVELLPWLLNGSLEEEERQKLLHHLRACESCRGEFTETAQAWQVFAQHIPSLALAEYAQGLMPSNPDPESIERHLALCASCRQELQWAVSDRVVELEEARAARRRSQVSPGRGRDAPRRWLALAASLGALVLAGLIWSIVESGSSSSRDEVAILDGSAVTAALERGQDRDRRSGAENRTADLFVDGFESGSVRSWSTATR